MGHGQVGWENPAELKAAKLARSVTRGVIDRDLKPNGDERRHIAAVLRLPPNKPLQAEAKALLWRFRCAGQACSCCVWFGEVRQQAADAEYRTHWFAQSNRMEKPEDSSRLVVAGGGFWPCSVADACFYCCLR
jgi:hypothetical protein